MKMPTKLFLFRLAVISLPLLTFMLPKPVAGQGTLDALNVSPIGGAAMGQANQGVGWSFVPTSDLLVTAINATGSQVDFWLGSNQNIASYNYAGPYQSGQFIFNVGAPTSFQSVSPLLMSAGQTYFISTQQPNFSSSINTFAYSLNGTNGLLPFNASPYISQFASYYLASDGQWSSTTSPESENINYLMAGPNFRFQVVPEPTSFELSVLVVGVWFLWKRSNSKCFHVRQIFRPIRV